MKQPRKPFEVVEYDPKRIEAIRETAADKRTKEDSKYLAAYESQLAYLERRENRNLTAQQVVEKLPNTVYKYAQVRGKWVWIEFPAKPADKIRHYLTQLGFHFNRQRSDEKGTSCWQHAGGEFRRFNPKEDPRVKYGGVAVKTFLKSAKDETAAA